MLCGKEVTVYVRNTQCWLLNQVANVVIIVTDNATPTYHFLALLNYRLNIREQ
jgi:hypothetical protein